MANVFVAEEGKFISPHDAKLGGALCNSCKQALKWDLVQNNEDDIVYEAKCCDKQYLLKDSLFNKIQIKENT